MNNWYEHLFRINRLDNANTRWWIDIFLFDTVVRECLATNSGNINIWRIHRRAADDQAGHQYSLFYYSPHELFEVVKSFIADHKAVKILQSENLLRELIQNSKGKEIEATSDPSWPVSLQRSWPYFIMGTSQMALELIANLQDSSRPDLESASINECELYYSQLMVKFIDVWKTWGSHAFFHHINAVFGYSPLIAKPNYVAGMLASF